MDQQYRFNKKTLIVSHYAPPMIGGPQSLYYLLSQFDGSSYAILTSAYNIDHLSGTTGSWLTTKYYYTDHSGSWNDIQTEAVDGTRKLPLAGKIILTIRRIPIFGSSLGDIISVCFQILSNIRRMRKIEKVDNIEALLGISDVGPALLSTYFLHIFFRLPYSLFLFDLYRGNVLGKGRALGILARIFEAPLFKSASLIIVNNEGTANFLHKRYGNAIRTEVVHNSVFSEMYDSRRTPYQPASPYTILFTGHVYWAQEQAVLNLIAAMNWLRDFPVKLDLYIPKGNDVIARAIEGNPHIRLTSASQSEMPKIQSQATLLFLPLAWDTKAPDIIATATPGKFTDYLASGRPMLIHAPEYAYISQYSRQHNLGLVVDQNDVELLAGTIRNFLEHPEIGQEYIHNSLNTFRHNHDAKTNAGKFAQILNSI